MKRFLLLLIVTSLAACSQVPDNIPTELSPMTFGSAGYDVAFGLAKHDKGVYVVGYTTGKLDGAPHGGGDAFVRKYDTTGAVLWGKQFGTNQYDYAYGVASDAGNNVYVVGNTSGSLANSQGLQDIFLRKYRANGELLWTRQFGSTSADFAGDVAIYGGNIYVTGSVGGNVLLTKFTSDGIQRWTRLFGTPEGDSGTDVAVDGSGNPYVVGHTSGSLGGPNGGGADMFIRKYNADGFVQWTRQLHYSNQDRGTAISISDSDIYMVGSFDAGPLLSYNIRLIRFNLSGVKTLDVTYGNEDIDVPTDVSADSNGVVFAGFTYGPFAGPNQGDRDGFVVKRPKYLPGFSWVHQLGTSRYDDTNAVLLRGSSEVYAAGGTKGILGGGNSGSSDAYLRQIDRFNGTTIWTDQ